MKGDLGGGGGVKVEWVRKRVFGDLRVVMVGLFPHPKAVE